MRGHDPRKQVTVYLVAAEPRNIDARAGLHNPIHGDLLGDEIRVSHNRPLDEPDPFERPSLPFQKRTRQLSAAMNELPLGSVLVGQAEVMQHGGDERGFVVNITGGNQASPEKECSITVVEQVGRRRGSGKVGSGSGSG